MSVIFLNRKSMLPMIWLLSRRDNSRTQRTAFEIVLFLLLVLLCFSLLYFQRKQMVVEKTVFKPSSRELHNPNRGFYYIYGFRIEDKQTDYEQTVGERYRHDMDTAITQVQINLQTYRDREISQIGLDNIENLFCALESIDKRLIVRFLYDWNGENEQYEPENLDIILTHMQQLEEILYRHRQQIFVMQGLFIGNWGEMNGTAYSNAEDMQRLTQELERVTDPSIYLAVRMPAQWRKITQTADPLQASRLGLFNDGILGSESDYGTYGTQSAEEAGEFSPWNREEELDFQENLCRQVPNGGEVIVDNRCNDFDKAQKDLAVMHITYLNRDYDQNVLHKWSEETVEEEGYFDGMDGLTYIERHLGYRLYIADTQLTYHWLRNGLSVSIELKNAGFAPIYREPDVYLTVCGEKDRLTYTFEEPLNQLTGGIHSDESLRLQARIPLGKISGREYRVYFSIVDRDTGKHILLANEQEEEAEGYFLGRIY